MLLVELLRLYDITGLSLFCSVEFLLEGTSPSQGDLKLTSGFLNSYIQMAGMIVGGMIGADKRLIAYELQMRHQKRMLRDSEVWRRYEEDFESKGTPGVQSEGKVGRKGDEV